MMEGGGYAEPVYNAQGEQIAAVDTTQRENYLAQLHGAVQKLRRHGLPELSSRPRTRAGRRSGILQLPKPEAAQGRDPKAVMRLRTPFSFLRKVKLPASKTDTHTHTHANAASVNCLQTEKAVLEGGNFAVGKTATSRSTRSSDASSQTTKCCAAIRSRT
jgi:hypothetical protein